jgi:hypothetical protein
LSSAIFCPVAAAVYVQSGRTLPIFWPLTT